MQALESGKDVFVEKPLALSVAEGEKSPPSRGRTRPGGDGGSRAALPLGGGQAQGAGDRRRIGQNPYIYSTA
jgi:hypothetical protein